MFFPCSKTLPPTELPDYDKFWALFGNVLKEGLGEDPTNKERIAKLLRFVSTGSEGKADVTLEGYISRMKTGQDTVYYVIGDTPEAAAKSPLLELFKKKTSKCFFSAARSIAG